MLYLDKHRIYLMGSLKMNIQWPYLLTLKRHMIVYGVME